MGIKQSTMESLVKYKLFNGVYENKRIFITGHTGFKGSWLAFWLQSIGAIAKGYSLAPNTKPSHWSLLNLDMESVYGDIRDEKKLAKEISVFEPDIVFHLAAQPIVRLSYDKPVETYETNVIGTLKVFEACRTVNSVKAIVNITTDKVYDNKEWVWGYRENDALGGYDPYSSSKACSEILTASYRNSFFNLNEYGKSHNVLISSVRAGNVIGGGDWAADRLIPDIMKATDRGDTTEIRNPVATRPWQHVLEPLSGYLLLGSELLKGNKKLAESWNFGPEDSSNLSVKQVCDYIVKYWDKAKFKFGEVSKGPHEANLLKLDCSKANSVLEWNPVWGNETCFMKTAEWFKNFYENKTINTEDDLINYIEAARKKQLIWTL